MKSIKFRMLAMMFIAALAFSACSDDDDRDSIKVPEAISQALTDKYPSAARIEWKQKGGYYVAECNVNGHESDIWFNKQAEWQLTESDISWDNLPGTVQTSFSSSEYADWKIDDIDKLEYLLAPIQFVIEVEKGNTEYQLIYSEEGNLMQVRDVTGKDDTHWPVSNL